MYVCPSFYARRVFVWRRGAFGAFQLLKASNKYKQRYNKALTPLPSSFPPSSGYIDLSKRRVSPDDVIKCEERYNKAKAVHSVLRHVADQHGLWLEDLYKKVGWPLYRKHGHAFDAFSKVRFPSFSASLPPSLHGIDSFTHTLPPSLLFALPQSLLPEGDERYEDVFADLDITPELKDSIVTYIKRRLAPKPIKIRADIEVTCFAYEGIEAIRAALQAGLDTPTSSELDIKLIAPPM